VGTFENDSFHFLRHFWCFLEYDICVDDVIYMVVRMIWGLSGGEWWSYGSGLWWRMVGMGGPGLVPLSGRCGAGATGSRVSCANY